MEKRQESSETILAILRDSDASTAAAILARIRSSIDPDVELLVRYVRDGNLLLQLARDGSVNGFDEASDTCIGFLRNASSRISHAESAVTKSNAAAGLNCFNQLLSWRSCRPKSRNSSLRAGTRKASLPPSTILSLPPLPLDICASESEVDIWTQTGWTRAYIQHLVDALLTWDYLPFCLFCKDLFWQDYCSGSNLFCLSALVNAILALSTYLINENDDPGPLPSGWFGSRLFFDEAKLLVRDNGPSSSLPDIQALGVLSLYHMRCRREADAQGLAQTFATSITRLCQYPPLGGEEGQYARARATTYCGAVSLIRYALEEPPPSNRGWLSNRKAIACYLWQPGISSTILVPRYGVTYSCTSCLIPAKALSSGTVASDSVSTDAGLSGTAEDFINMQN